MKYLVVVCAVLLAGCATVRQSDLDAWVNMPVEALDTHPLFVTLPLVRTKTESGIEVRNYANGMDVSRCSGQALASGSRRYVTVDAFSNCTHGRVVCNNIFYIRDGKVLEYAPTGRCYTDATVRPQVRRFDQQ